MSNETNQISVTRSDFSKLLNLLKIFENICTDCDIKNGQFRCKSNDRQAIIEMDMSSILQENNLSFSLVKNKVALLKSFELDDNIPLPEEKKNIIIESNESNYEIYDAFSRLIFRKPLPKYIDNQFMTQQDFASMISISDDKLIFSYDMNNYMKRRLANITIGFQTDVILCKLLDTEAQLLAATTNNEDSSVVSKDIPLTRNFGTCQFKMIAQPFLLDIASDLKLNCYETNKQGIYICRFDQSYYGVPISLYTLVKVVQQ